MSKMKHLLRKLHIGHTEPPTPTPTPPPLPTPSAATSSSTSSSNVSSLVSPVTDSSPSTTAAREAGGGGFNYFEEEFQMQMALAMSASDPYSKDDPETAQIKAAKQISLGVAPSHSPVEFLSLRYWTYNVINYDEKIMDGFYDVNGVISNPTIQGRMPSLVDLAAVSILDNHNHEVIVVNREEDVGLRDVEERAMLISRECQSLRNDLSRNLLVQKIANLVANRLGGPVTDAEEISKKWTARSYQLKVSLVTIVLPLGCLDVGHSRHRALLFKVLADKVNLPCMLVKGSYYTGTDEGAVNMIKFDNGSEYIIDLMGAPGTLIPAEVSSNQLPTYNARDVSTVTDNSSSSQASTSEPPCMSHTSGDLTISQSTEDPTFHGNGTKGASGSGLGNIDIQKLWYELGNASSFSAQQSVVGNKGSTAERKQVNDVSEYVISAAKDPEFAQKLHAVLLESGASPPLNLFSSIGSDGYGEQKLLQNLLTTHKGDRRKSFSEMSDNEWGLISVTREHTFQGPSDVNGRDMHRNVLAKSEHSGNDAELTAHQSVSTLSSIAVGKTPENQVLGISNGIVNDDPPSLRIDQIDKILEAVAEWEIQWEALQIAERVGIGSYGEVYRAEWNGTEVAVKKFMNQDMSSDALALFKCEVEIMSRLRHPNVVLFMGAVTRPPNLSILTEFLPRGSLYKLLHKPKLQLDEKRRMRMALDVAKGMNYLHTSHPVIVHRDLKTPNLLVDKNWVVKVCDFGMSRIKYHTFLSSKSNAGTAEWMAPEILRNEPSNEKSDVYSFGVILWELATLEVPWAGYHSMQVVGAVAFQGRRLTIPPRVSLEVAELIRECWFTNPQERPSFRQIITRLKNLKSLENPKAGVSLKALKQMASSDQQQE